MDDEVKKPVVLNVGIMLQVIAGAIAAGMAALPQVQTILAPETFGLLFVLFSVATGAYIAWDKAQRNTTQTELVAQVRRMRGRS